MPLVNGLENFSKPKSTKTISIQTKQLDQVDPNPKIMGKQVKETDKMNPLTDWMTNLQKNSWYRYIFGSNVRQTHILRHSWSRTVRRIVRNDQENPENNQHRQRSTEEPPIVKIFAPNNNDRFDSWGG